VDCHMSPEEGEIFCDYVGVCKSTVWLSNLIYPSSNLCFLKDVVEFDNTFSYLRSKKIWYSITIESSKPVCQNGNNLDYLDAEICNWINNAFARLDIKGHNFVTD
jgi:hypothetical protein